MQSPQKNNPHRESQPLPPIVASNNLNFAEPDKEHPFSLRRHVLACRRRDVYSNWPFPEKYLQLCLSRGIKEVLPPLESHKSALQSIRGVPGLNRTQQEDEIVDHVENEVSDLDGVVQDIEYECQLNTETSISDVSFQGCPSPSNIIFEDEVNEKVNDLSPHVASSTSVIVSTGQPSTSVQSATTLTSIMKLNHKEKRHYTKPKKRSMADILEVAKPCTFEELLRVKRLCCISNIPLELGDEDTGGRIDVENNCQSDLTKDYSSEKVETDCEAASLREGLGVKFKVSGCGSTG